MQATFTLQQLPQIAVDFWKQFPTQKIFAFYGAMGAGKTTFIQSLLTAKGVQGAVSSPTYSIINQYSYPEGTIYHMDLYRLAGEEEAMQAGVEDILYSGNICFAEWPERAPALFPEETLEIHIDIIDANTRRVSVL